MCVISSVCGILFVEPVWLVLIYFLKLMTWAHGSNSLNYFIITLEFIRGWSVFSMEFLGKSRVSLCQSRQLYSHFVQDYTVFSVL